MLKLQLVLNKSPLLILLLGGLGLLPISIPAAIASDSPTAPMSITTGEANVPSSPTVASDAPIASAPAVNVVAATPTVAVETTVDSSGLKQQQQTLPTEWQTTEMPTVSIDQVANLAEVPLLNSDPLVAETEYGIDQVTSVSQLSDVQPTDWAFQALQSLVERYGCIAGYPDGTYRGNRALSRYEFAAGVNACLDRINELIGASTANLVRKEDLLALQRLQEEFAAELASLRGRVDVLEARTAELEANQFSTTTKLFGQVIIGVQGRTDNDIRLAGFTFKDDNTNINVISNVQLSLFTQFNSRSILLTGLQAGNGNTGRPVLTNDVLLSYEADTGNQVQISDLTYRQLIGNRFAFIVGPEGLNAINVFRGANRVESAGFGPLSRFAQRNPVIGIGAGRGGVGFDWQILSRLSLQGVYSASLPNLPSLGGIGGGQDGRTSIGGQLNWSPFDAFDIALNYINAYSNDGFLGTGVGDDQLALSSRTDFRIPLKTHAYGATVSWRVTPRFTVGGWGGYTYSTVPGETGSVETVNWMAFLNFPDLFGQGNLGAIFVGQPPRITSSDLRFGRNVPNLVNEGGFGEKGGQPGTTTHLEAFYRFRVTDNIYLTPGVIVILNPRNNDDNPTITIGALRTTIVF